MNSYTKLQRNIAKLAIVSLITLISPIGAVNATNLTNPIEITPNIGNNVNPSYGFDSDLSGTIAYSGACAPYGVLTSAIAGANITTFNTLPEGTYSSCTIQVDASNILTLATFIIDTTTPVANLTGYTGTITLPYSGAVEAVNITYANSGAEWTDNFDGTGNTFTGIYGNTGSFQSTGSITSIVPGVVTYIITYLKVDAAGNSGSVTRTIIGTVAAPVINLTGSSALTIPVGTYYSVGASYIDGTNASGSTLFGTYGSTGSFQSTGTLVDGVQNQTGSFTRTYHMVDATGNSGSVTRTVNVTNTIDTTVPVVFLVGFNNLTIPLGSIYTDSGATWSDNVDGTGSALIGIYGNTGSFQSTGTLINGVQNATGTFTRTYLKVDAAGNTGSITRTVTVTNIPDTTAPSVTLYGPPSFAIALGTNYTDLGASWTDNVDGSGNTMIGTYGNTGSFQSTGTLVNGVQSQTGVFIKTYLKVDAAGNTGSVTRTVTVIGVITLSGAVSGTGSAVVSTGTVQPGTLIITNGNSINTTSTGGSLSISGSVNFLLSGSVWNGILYAPVVSTLSVLSIGDAGVVTNLPQDTPTTDYSYTVLPTYMAGGTGGTSIIASGGVFTLTMQVNSPSVSSGTSLPIFRSTDSVTWTLNSPQSSCILDSSLTCTFTTDHLSYFGFVQVTSTPIVATPTTSNSGPGGGSYSSAPSTITNPMLTVQNPISNGVVVDTFTNDSVTPRVTRPKRTPKTNTTTSDSFLDDLFSDITDTSTTDNSNPTIDNSSTESNDAPRIVGKAYILVKNSLRVRAGTSFNTPVVAYIYRNQEIEVIDNDTPNWSHIRFYTAKGTPREGYILSYYVREMTNIDKIRGGIISFAEATMNMPEITGYINVAHSLNLRSSASVNSRIKAILKPDTQVIMLDTIGKWREIMTDTYHGYVLSKFIKQ